MQKCTSIRLCFDTTAPQWLGFTGIRTIPLRWSRDISLLSMGAWLPIKIGENAFQTARHYWIEFACLTKTEMVGPFVYRSEPSGGHRYKNVTYLLLK